MDTQQRKISAALLMVIAIVGMATIAWNVTRDKPAEGSRVTNFMQCVAAGNPVSESYPEQCSDGENTYVNDQAVTPEASEMQGSTNVTL